SRSASVVATLVTDAGWTARSATTDASTLPSSASTKTPWSAPTFTTASAWSAGSSAETARTIATLASIASATHRMPAPCADRAGCLQAQMTLSLLDTRFAGGVVGARGSELVLDL